VEPTGIWRCGSGRWATAAKSVGDGERAVTPLPEIPVAGGRPPLHSPVGEVDHDGAIQAVWQGEAQSCPAAQTAETPVGTPGTGAILTRVKLLGGPRGTSTTPNRAAMEARLKAKLEPEVLRWHLAVAGLVATMHEVIKSLVIESVRDFVTFPSQRDDRYSQEVLSLGGGRFDASCKWLANAGLLTDDDRDLLRRFKQLRDAMTHELMTVAFSPDIDIDFDLIARVGDVVRRLDVFWVRVDMDANPEFDGRDIEDDDIASGAGVFLGCLVNALVEPYVRDDSSQAG
jgi:hypothetical protein